MSVAIRKYLHNEECSRTFIIAIPKGIDQKRARIVNGTLFGGANINGLAVFKWRCSQISISYYPYLFGWIVNEGRYDNVHIN